MQNPLDLFGAMVRAKRNEKRLTQHAVAEKLHMSVRTIIDIELCKSSPRFETVVALARELGISLDAIVFQNTKTDSISQSVVDFFFGKSEADARKYIALCEQAEAIRPEK